MGTSDERLYDCSRRACNAPAFWQFCGLAWRWCMDRGSDIIMILLPTKASLIFGFRLFNSRGRARRVDPANTYSNQPALPLCLEIQCSSFTNRLVSLVLSAHSNPLRKEFRRPGTRRQQPHIEAFLPSPNPNPPHHHHHHIATTSSRRV